jgi:hypothetical protein
MKNRRNPLGRLFGIFAVAGICATVYTICTQIIICTNSSQYQDFL